MSFSPQVKGAAILVTLISLCACSSFKSDVYQAVRYKQFSDSAPEAPPNLENIPDAVPKYEPKSAGGNKPVYTVRGKSYRVLESAEGFVEQGHASWYGQKFHGHKTSNGEIYDMYSMSAAHKNLPLPSYVKVTRLDSGKQIIVRVNDRGPFHSGRIIDLSYAAAHRLGMLQNGTAKVRLEAITLPPPWKQTSELDAIAQIGEQAGAVEPALQVKQPPEPIQAQPQQQTTGAIFLQLTVTGDKAKADHLVAQLDQLFDVAARAVQENQLHKIQLGPFGTEVQADNLLKQLKRGEFSSAFKVYVQ